METMISLDCGNSQIKVVHENGTRSFFPHALRELTLAEVEEIVSRDAFEGSPNLWQVNNVWYEVGAKALHKGNGSALYGASRYVNIYYGVLAAIACSSVLSASERGLFLYGSHTPKDHIYRKDMHNSVVGKWAVVNAGVVKNIQIANFRAFDEPVGAYRHATLDDSENPGYRGPKVLREGRCLVLDIGGFTTALSIADEGKIDYNASISHGIGMLDVLSEFEKLIRSDFRQQLKSVNFINQVRLREALHEGVLNAGGCGTLDVRKEAEHAREMLMREIKNLLYERRGGNSDYDSILIAGGGGSAMERTIRNTIDNPNITIEVAEPNRNQMHFGTAMGGMKMLKLLRSRGKI
jgi:hypothetical protein